MDELLPVPKRTTLVTQVADILRQGLDRRQWTHRLPGEQSLARQVQVSRMTLRAAMKLLVAEKRIEVSNGQRARILPSSRARRGIRPRVVAVLSPNPIGAHSWYASYYEVFRQDLQQGGVEVHFHHGARFFGPNPDAALARLRRETRADVWILTGSTDRLQRWFHTRRIPAIVDGSCQPGVALPALDLDYRAICRHAASTLIGLGHRRIVFLMVKSAAGGDLASEIGFREAVEKSGRTGLGVRVIACEPTVPHLTAVLTRLFRDANRPTALFAQRWLPFTALTFLQQRGLRVPDDVSLLSRDDLPNLELLVPAIARYGFPANLYTQRMVRMTWRLLEGTLPPRQEFIVPDFIRGASIGPAPRA